MQLVKVPEERVEQYFNQFYNLSVFTFEGLDVADKEGLKTLEAHIKERGFKGDEVVMFYFSGKQMNEHFGLTESNAYKDDLTFVAIPDFYDPLYKVATGARWFDDIVSNNTIRQNAINHKTPRDYGTN